MERATKAGGKAAPVQENHEDLLAGVRRNLESRITELGEVTAEMREVRSREERPGQGTIFELAATFEEVSDFEDTISILYRLEEVARLSTEDAPSEAAEPLNEAWTSLCVASVCLWFHAHHLRGTAGCPLPIDSSPRRGMSAISHIEAAIDAVQDAEEIFGRNQTPRIR